ncbi:PREDICTED: uncharacterized protein LOC109207274 [Nicotiana attenuata]|uniref:uncharacterized protein LOC109207274 n=1 Tax=Nicotiana attenuata TaxID=49451 RepID=UPI000905A0F3|nr:PREDICTED: uncharacterized protein LOC109207274 [Nicotiana attenuata]
MAALSSVSVAHVSFSISNPQIPRNYRRLPTLFASASATPSHESSSSTQSGSILSSTNSPPKVPFVESSEIPENGFNFALANPNGNPVVRLVQHTESTIERAIFDFRFLAFLAIGGSLAGSLLCFLNGCVYIIDAYKVYWTSCVKGIHTGQMVLRLVEAIDVYLAGTVMFIFGMGLYGLFITNSSANVDPTSDRALKHSSLFGMFALKAIFDFRFLALLAIGGSLSGSLLCFLNGCVYIFDAYKVYWSSCVKGIHTGQMVLRLVEAIGEFLNDLDFLMIMLLVIRK